MQFIILLIYTLVVLIRPQEWIEGMAGFPIVSILANITIALCFMAVATRKLKIPRVPENYLMLGLFFATLMSHVANTNLEGLIMAFKEFSKITIFYFLTLIIVDSVNKVKILSWAFILSAIFMAINGILQFYKGMGLVASPLIIDELGVKRITGVGIFGDPNDVCLFFVMILPLVLALLLEKRGFFQSFLAVIFSILITWGVWLTNSRSGMLAFIIALLVFFRRRFKGMQWVMIAGICLVIIIAFLPSRLTGKIIDLSSRERVIFWGYGNIAFKSHMLFGVGYNMLWLYSDNKASHNSFIQCYGELGIFGYFFWAGMFYSVILGLSKLDLYRKTKPALCGKDMVLLAEAFIASLCGYLTISMFLSRTYLVPLYIFLALAVKIRYLATGGKFMVGDLLSAKQMRKMALIAGLSILMLYFATKFLVGKLF